MSQNRSPCPAGGACPVMGKCPACHAPGARRSMTEIEQGIPPSDPSTAWRGIASAPRDGSWFLAVCWTHGHPSVRQVHFADEFDRLPINEHVPGMWPTAPTHWMPLPGAPS